MFERLRGIFRRPDQVVQEWEWYARNHARTHGTKHLGDEWNEPSVIGMDVAATDIVEHLDRTLIEPYLGVVETLLEIGSGGGRFTGVLARRAARVFATDTSPTMLRILRSRFAADPVVEVRQVDGIRLAGFEDASISAAFSYDVFVHLEPWQVFANLEELRRVLRPGGRAILHHANTFSPLGWQRFLKDVDRVRRREPAQARFTPMTPEFMRGLVERAGLAVHECVTDLVRRDGITLAFRPR